MKTVVALVPSVGSNEGSAAAQSAAQANRSPGATVPFSATAVGTPAMMLVGLIAGMINPLVFVLQQTHFATELHPTGLVPGGGLL